VLGVQMFRYGVRLPARLEASAGMPAA
jgi:hypothetical protein